MTSKKRSYSAALKLEAIEFAEKNSGEAAARKYKVDPKTIRDWKKRKNLLKNQVSTAQGSCKKRLDGAGAKLVSEELDLRLFDWICDLQMRNVSVSRQMIMDEARKLFPTMSDRTSDFFVASRGWLQKFLERHKLNLAPRKKNVGIKEFCDDVGKDDQEIKQLYMCEVVIREGSDGIE